ncbi:hypothetical protein B484DRAFT_442658, partial [Ochromonadaceae sp. CCMP2298]
MIGWVCIVFMWGYMSIVWLGLYGGLYEYCIIWVVLCLGLYEYCMGLGGFIWVSV